MKKCPFCGAELNDNSHFCAECGAAIRKTDASSANGEYPLGLSSDDSDMYGEDEYKERIFKKYLPYILGCIVVVLVVGIWLCRNYFLANNNTLVENDSISLTTKVEQEHSADSSIDKKEKNIPFKIVLDIYRQGSKNQAIKILKEYGYALFRVNDGVEVWTKDVVLKEKVAYDGSTVYEPTSSRGSSASLSGNSSELFFNISVYNKKDFDEWIKQIESLGYKYKSYEHPLEEDGWSPIGAKMELFRKYEDKNGNTIEFMKDGEHYTTYLVEFTK